MTFSAKTCYTNRVRWLNVQTGQDVAIRFYFGPLSPQGPRIELVWVSPWGLGWPVQDRTLFVCVMLYPSEVAPRFSRTVWRFYDRHVHDTWVLGQQSNTLDHRLPGVSDLLSIACNVAAKKCDPTLLVGFIEDKWPAPYSKLATDTPLDCIRALCPMRLAGDKENES